VTGPAELVALVELASEDLCDAGAISKLVLEPDAEATTLSVTVELSPDDGSGPAPAA
jgi:hypothetical protein